MEKNTSLKKDKYVRGIDGLRSLAILMVLAYHLRLPFARGGLSGVTIFFVLSGFLITRNILTQLDENGKLDVVAFWKKRILRLYPVMIVMIITLIFVSAMANRILFTKACHDIPSVLFGYNNYWQIFSNVSYFNRSGIASPLMHFWSLAIELQFYLFYPLLIVLLSKVKKDRKLFAGVTLILGVISAGLMWNLFSSTADPSRIYYGSDTRMFSLLFGALPAFAEEYIRRKGSPKVKSILSAILLEVLLWSMVALDGYSRGGQIFVTLIGVLLVALFVDRRNVVGRIMSIKLFHWLSQRSYGLYIWHFPIILLMSEGKKAGIGMIFLEILIIFIVSELSYRWIEVPVKEDVIGKTLRKIKKKPENEKERKSQLRLKERVKRLAFIGGTLVLAALLCIAFVPRKSSIAKPTKVETKKHKKTKPRKDAVKDLDLLLVGDSIAADAVNSFDEIFPDSICDTKIGRNAYEAPGIIKKYKKEYSWDGDAVILSLAINGPLNNSLQEVRDVIGKDKPLFIVTGKAPYEMYEESNNKKIYEFAKVDQNTYVIDWYKYSKDHPEYFDQDETHLLPEGGKAYTDCIKKTVLKVLKENGD